MGDETTGALARRMLEYIRANADAGESIERIAMWWKAIEGMDESVDRVTLALEELVEKGLIVKRDVKNGIFLYTPVT